MDPTRRLSLLAPFLALAGLLLGLAATIDAAAHHPGSHAWRLPDGGVRLEAVANVTDGCTTIGSVERGEPPAASAARDAEPVTLRLRRPADAACTQVLTTVRREVVLTVPAGRSVLHLFTVDPDGRILATERIPVR